MSAPPPGGRTANKRSTGLRLRKTGARASAAPQLPDPRAALEELHGRISGLERRRDAMPNGTGERQRLTEEIIEMSAKAHEIHERLERLRKAAFGPLEHRYLDLSKRRDAERADKHDAALFEQLVETYDELMAQSTPLVGAELDYEVMQESERRWLRTKIPEGERRAAELAARAADLEAQANDLGVDRAALEHVLVKRGIVDPEAERKLVAEIERAIADGRTQHADRLRQQYHGRHGAARRPIAELERRQADLERELVRAQRDHQDEDHELAQQRRRLAGIDTWFMVRQREAEARAARERSEQAEHVARLRTAHVPEVEQFLRECRELPSTPPEKE